MADLSCVSRATSVLSQAHSSPVQPRSHLNCPSTASGTEVRSLVGSSAWQAEVACWEAGSPCAEGTALTLAPGTEVTGIRGSPAGGCAPA